MEAPSAPVPSDDVVPCRQLSLRPLLRCSSAARVVVLTLAPSSPSPGSDSRQKLVPDFKRLIPSPVSRIYPANIPP